jgi:hypothetical protein
MTEHENVFKYKLDFYYQSALIYLVTMIVYGGIRGNFVEAKFEYVLNDPLMYVIMFFVLMSFAALGLNYLRDRRVIITQDEIIFRNRWKERRISVSDIEWMHIGRESHVQTGGRFQAVLFKLARRRRVYRIRVGRYERERQLIAEMHRFAGILPRRKARRWQRPRISRQGSRQD